MTSLLLLGAAAGTLTAQIVTVVLGFFILMWILAKFAWSPVIKTIDERRETIAREFDTIEKRQAHLESQIKDYEERLRQIDNEARERMNKAIDEGRRTATELVEEARRAADEMRNKAQQDIKLEIEKARVELRDTVVSLTIRSSEKLLRAELTDARHRELVGSFISEIEGRQSS